MDLDRTGIYNLIKDKVINVSSSKHNSNVIFLKGEAGIGKTTLLNSIKSNLETTPELFLVSEAECSTPLAGKDIGGSEALLPWINLLDNLVNEDKQNKHHTHQLINDLALAWIKLIPVVGSVISDTAGAFKKFIIAKKESDDLGAIDQGQLFQQYINLLKKLSENVTVILILDDFHWSDSSSCNLLFAASRQLIENKVLFIISYRPEDVTSGTTHPIINIKNELMRYSLSEDIEMAGITRTEIKDILSLYIKKYHSNSELENWLLNISKGNALFITQYLISLRDDGFIDDENGIVSAEYQNIKVPQTVNAVIENRIRHLSDEMKNLLRYASVEGDVFSLLVLSHIMEKTALQLIQKLRSIEEQNKLIKSLGKQKLYFNESTSYIFANTLIHKLLYDSLEYEEKEILHNAVFDVIKKEWEIAVKEGTNVIKIASRLSAHAEILHKYLFAAEVLLEGAKASWKTYSEDETLKQIDEALKLLKKAAHDSDEFNKTNNDLKGHLIFLRGKVNENRARFEQALDDLKQSRDIFKKTENEKMFVDTTDSLAKLLGNLTAFDEGIEYCNEALEIADKLNYRKGKAFVLNTLACILESTNRRNESIILYNENLKYYKEINDISGYVSTLNNLGNFYNFQKEFDKSLGYLHEAEEILNTHEDLYIKPVVLKNIGLAFEELGRFDEALELIKKALHIREKTGNLVGQAFCTLEIGTLKRKLNNYESAIYYFQKSKDIFNNIGEEDWATWVMCDIGSTFRLMKKFDDSRAYFKNAFENIEKMIDDTTKSKIYGEMALLEKSESENLSGKLKNEKLNKAKDYLKKAIDFLDENNPMEMKQWQNELDSIVISD